MSHLDSGGRKFKSSHADIDSNWLPFNFSFGAPSIAMAFLKSFL